VIELPARGNNGRERVRLRRGSRGAVVRIHLQADTRLTSIRAIRRAARCLLDTLGAPDDTAGDIEIALGEALANAHEHAYHGAVGPIDIDFEIELAEFRCRIRDYGHSAAVPPHVPRGPSVGDHRGLYLMDRLMDMMEITSTQNGESGIEVRMRRFLVHS